VQMGLSSQHTRLASYLPAELVDAYSSVGMTHDLYQWQVRWGLPVAVACMHTG